MKNRPTTMHALVCKLTGHVSEVSLTRFYPTARSCQTSVRGTFTPIPLKPKKAKGKK